MHQTRHDNAHIIMMLPPIQQQGFLQRPDKLPKPMFQATTQTPHTANQLEQQMNPEFIPGNPSSQVETAQRPYISFPNLTTTTSTN
jgi:hypothetical protein